MTESDKFEVLEKIGKPRPKCIPHIASLVATHPRIGAETLKANPRSLLQAMAPLELSDG